MGASKILLEGRPGVGKTTLLRAVARALPAEAVGGFSTEEIREGGRRVGFRVETFNGRSGILAHTAFKSGPAVGRYRVNVAAFEAIAVKELERALDEAEIILVDEIGKMELFSLRFRELLRRLLDSPQPLIATVMLRPHPFVDEIKARPGVERITVTERNRSELAAVLAQRVAADRGTV